MENKVAKGNESRLKQENQKVERKSILGRGASYALRDGNPVSLEPMNESPCIC